ncbi:HlyD family secretion protein [Methylovirgula sp. 4M-Z18]|uniref:HlyD family secretion protein n=1 Tax=Methylovirgula sp. 4M-Z18 TaxID=2293567 RepID=UPI000E2EC15F|nr:HlyD family secretion protein [Methylovirgula sp. 4M-Z18]RFB81556.1 HlyD family efflux transporter periplasmic adaptor subunit [Methylovirgula sp. 4M-Z18]
MSDTAKVETPGPVSSGAKERPAEASALPRVILFSVVVACIVALALWYAAQPQPLLVQGEADARRIDIAARVDGRVSERPVDRGQNVKAGDLLVAIDNPELVDKLNEAKAARGVAAANLARILVGTRQEIIDARKAAIASAEANVKLQQQTYDRTRKLSESSIASIQSLEESTASLEVANRALDQAKASLAEAIAGYTPEEKGVAAASVTQADAAIASLQAQVDELTIKAPSDSQVYQVGVEIGEYVAPGVPLLSLVDLNDVWLRFDLREDLVKRIKVGDKHKVHIPALGNREITAEIRWIAARGEYTSWRATRATGDFDLRTFEVRAYPTEKIPELRPGMSAYLDVQEAK